MSNLSPAALILFLLVAGCAAPETLPQAPAAEAGPSGATPGLGIVEGGVADESFRPIQGAKVSLVGTQHATTTAWNGHFELRDIQPGAYRLRIEHPAWAFAEVDANVLPDQISKVTVFLDPAVTLEPYSTLDIIRGEITCADVQALEPTSITCETKKFSTWYPEDWAAVLIEITWGPSGFSSSSLAELTAGHIADDGTEKVYAKVVAPEPGRITLQPGRVHNEQGGRHPTPGAGVVAPLDIGIRKDPTRPVEDAGVGFTLQQTYEIYLTTFFYAAPSDLDEYTALPE